MVMLLAKLKLLADRMPLENGAGVCVLSHTNVAVDEIRNRLSEYADCQDCRILRGKLLIVSYDKR